MWLLPHVSFALWTGQNALHEENEREPSDPRGGVMFELRWQYRSIYMILLRLCCTSVEKSHSGGRVMTMALTLSLQDTGMCPGQTETVVEIWAELRRIFLSSHE